MTPTAPPAARASRPAPSSPAPSSRPAPPADPLGRWALGVLLRLRAVVQRLVAGAAGRPGGERGDVPGWVLVTVMTAGLVIVLWAAAQTALASMFSSALSSVTRPAG